MVDWLVNIPVLDGDVFSIGWYPLDHGEYPYVYSKKTSWFNLCQIRTSTLIFNLYINGISQLENLDFWLIFGPCSPCIFLNTGQRLVPRPRKARKPRWSIRSWKRWTGIWRLRLDAFLSVGTSWENRGQIPELQLQVGLNAKIMEITGDYQIESKVKWHFNQPRGDFKWPTWCFNQARCDVVTFEDDRQL